jgi:cytochrome c553
MSDSIRLSVVCLAAVIAMALGSFAVAGDAERGAVLASTCLGCHGIPGYRNAYPSFRVPMLGGQYEDYLVLALQGYRAGRRSHPTMNAQSASLSDGDLRDIAAYFASLGAAKQGEVVTGGRAAAGAEKVAVCSACHGQAGISPAPNWPILAGQHRDYLVHAIRQYRDGERQDPVMRGQVVNLTDQDIEDIAAFYAQQAGLFSISSSN